MNPINMQMASEITSFLTPWFRNLKLHRFSNPFEQNQCSLDGVDGLPDMERS